MANWLDPVFDRTEADVNFAKEQIALWRNKLEPVSDSYALKGCLNISDINRIEENVQYLSDVLNELGYPQGAYTKRWGKDNLPNVGDVRRILFNVELLLDAYYKTPGAPSVPGSMSAYTDINAIEENLYNIKQLLDIMTASFRKSGTFQSGSIRMLPIRR